MRVNSAARVSVLERIASLRLMYRHQSEPHEPRARVACAACIGVSGPVHIRNSHNPEPEHEHPAWSELTQRRSSVAHSLHLLDTATSGMFPGTPFKSRSRFLRYFFYRRADISIRSLLLCCHLYILSYSPFPNPSHKTLSCSFFCSYFFFHNANPYKNMDTWHTTQTQQAFRFEFSSFTSSIVWQNCLNRSGVTFFILRLRNPIFDIIDIIHNSLYLVYYRRNLRSDCMQT